MVEDVGHVGLFEGKSSAFGGDAGVVVLGLDHCFEASAFCAGSEVSCVAFGKFVCFSGGDFTDYFFVVVFNYEVVFFAFFGEYREEFDIVDGEVYAVHAFFPKVENEEKKLHFFEAIGLCEVSFDGSTVGNHPDDEALSRPGSFFCFFIGRYFEFCPRFCEVGPGHGVGFVEEKVFFQKVAESAFSTGVVVVMCEFKKLIVEFSVFRGALSGSQCVFFFGSIQEVGKNVKECVIFELFCVAFDVFRVAFVIGPLCFLHGDSLLFL